MSAQHSNQNTLASIAADLSALAGDLTKGKLRVGSRLVAIGNPLFMKTKQKISGDTAYYTLSFQAPLLEEAQNSILIPSQKFTPEENAAKKNIKELRLQGRPPEGKKIKKEITRLWKIVIRKLEQGDAPTPAEEKALVSAFADYTVFSEPAWHDDWLTCYTVLLESLDCARRGDLPKALEHAEKVNLFTKNCHKQYK